MKWRRKRTHQRPGLVCVEIARQRRVDVLDDAETGGGTVLHDAERKGRGNEHSVRQF